MKKKNNHLDLQRLRLKHWEQKASKWKLEGFLPPDTDVNDFAQNLNTIAHKIESTDLTNFLKILNYVRHNGILKKKEKDGIYDYFKEGLLLITLFLYPTSTPSEVYDGITNILAKTLNISKTNNDKINEIKKKITKKRHSIDKYFEKLYADGYIDQTWDKRKKEKAGAHGTRKELSFPSMSLIMGLHQNAGLILQNIADLTKAKDRRDIAMLVMEKEEQISHSKSKKQEKSNSKKILLLHHSENSVEYLRNKWAVPAIRIPAFSFSEVWNNTPIISNGVKEFAKSHNFSKKSFIQNELFMPAAHTGTYPAMIVTPDDLLVDNFQKLFEKNTNNIIENGPALFDDLRYFTFEEIFKMKSELEFKTLFFLSCKFAIEQEDPDEKTKILKEIKTEITKILGDKNYFESVFESNRKTEFIKELESEFESAITGEY